jgi:hypothetical protein
MAKPVTHYIRAPSFSVKFPVMHRERDTERFAVFRRARQYRVITGGKSFGCFNGASVKADMLLSKEQIDASAGSLDNRKLALVGRKCPIAQWILQK